MRLHASCAAIDGKGVLLIGEPGSGQSDLLLRLLEGGFELVADDQVMLDGGWASPPPELAGMLEVRGLGVVRLTYVASVAVTVAVRLRQGERMPVPERLWGLPVVDVDPRTASAPARVRLALRCATGSVPMVAGAFA